MENTPTGHADDLLTILDVFKNNPKSRSVNILFSGWTLPQTVKNIFFTSQSSAQKNMDGPFSKINTNKCIFFSGCGGAQRAPPEASGVLFPNMLKTDMCIVAEST